MTSFLFQLEFRGKLVNSEKSPRSKAKRGSNPHMAQRRNQSRAASLGGEISRHYAISAPRMRFAPIKCNLFISALD